MYTQLPCKDLNCYSPYVITNYEDCNSILFDRSLGQDFENYKNVTVLFHELTSQRRRAWDWGGIIVLKFDQMYVVCFTRSDSHLWLIKLINCYWIKLSISKSLLKGKMSMSAFGVVWFEGAWDSLSNSTSNLGPPSRSLRGGEMEREE